MIPLKLSLWFLGFLQFSEAAAGFYKNFTFTNDDGYVEMSLPEIQGDRIRLNSINCHRIIQQTNSYTNCIINQKMYSYDNSSDIISNRSCTVKFRSGTFAWPFHLIQLASLGDDRILYDVMYTKEEAKAKNSKIYNICIDPVLYHRKFQIVNMNNCQLINDVSLKVKLYERDYMANLLLHPDKSGKFDIFYKNSRSCSSLIGRESYDRDGNLVDDPNCILNNVKGTQNFFGKKGTTFMSFSNDSYFVFDVNDYRLAGYLLGYMNNDTKRIFYNANLYFDPKLFRLATQHNRIGYCLLSSIRRRNQDTTVNCQIYNTTTAEENQLSLVIPYEVQAFEILNLKNGDFLTISCSKIPYVETYDDREADKDDIKLSRIFDEKPDYIGWRTFELRRYRNNGTMKGEPIKIKGFTCESFDRDRVNLVEDGENRVCASFFCKITSEGKDERNKIEYAIGTKCVELED